MDSERALAVAEESFLVNLLSDETQEIIRHDMREYEIENGCRFERDETGKYLWMQNNGFNAAGSALTTEHHHFFLISTI